MRSTDTPLVKTKVLPPKVGTSVRREQLLKELKERRDSRLTLILGPAGSGKTTLISLWRQELLKAGHDVAWYNFGPDDDEAQFVAYVVASFASIGVMLGSTTPTFHDHSTEKSLDLLLPTLINSIEDQERTVYLVLEDLHYVASPAINRFLERLIALAPANFHLVLSSRSRPALALAALRAKNEVSELSFSELRFSVEETAAFLRIRSVRSLTMHDVAALHQLTDGWPAALQLAAFSLRRSSNPQMDLKLMASPVGLSREVAFVNYVREVAAESLSAEELDFLTRLSACRRFNRELSQIVTGNEHAAELLQRLESEQLFIIPIESGDDVPFFRFHRLFARFLQERLLQLPKDDLKELNQRASRWFADKRLYVEALRHAHYAQDGDFYVELLDRSARSFLKSSNYSQLLSWYEKMPGAGAGERINLLLCVGWAQLCLGRLDDFDRTAQAIHRHQQTLDAATQFELRLLEALRSNMREDTARTLELLEQFIAAPPANDFHALVLFDLVSSALIYNCQYERARDLVHHQRVLEIAERAGLPTPDIDAIEGLSYLEQGNMPLAKQSLVAVIQEAARASILSLDLEHHVGGYLALALYQMDEIEQAEALVDGCADWIKLGVSPSVWFSFLVQARIHDLRGNPSAGLDLLVQFENESLTRGRDRATALCQSEIVRLYTRSGQLLAAQEHLRRLSVLGDKYRTARACAYADIPLMADISLAELAMAMEEHQRAVDVLTASMELVYSQGRQYYVAMLSLKAAIAHAAMNSRSLATMLAGNALKLACQYNLRRLFLDESPRALDLLSELVHSGDLTARQSQFAQEVLSRRPASPKTAAGRTVAPMPQGQTEPLSQRELEILRLMDQSFSTKSIARALNLSVQTVKWYMKSMYAKLGAFSREGAVMQARKLGILSS